MRYILTALLIGLSASVFGRTDFVPYSEYSVRGNAGFMKTFVSGLPGDYSFAGTTFGGRFVYFGEKYCAAMIEVNYSNFTGTQTEVDGMSFSFVETPLMTRIRIPMKRTAVSIDLGSYIQFPLSYSSEIVMERSALFGLAGGLEFSFPVGKKLDLGIEGRYNYNLHSNSTTIDDLWSSWTQFGIVLSYRSK